MFLRDELERFEAALIRLAPESAAKLAPPADERAFTRLESAIAPYGIPSEVRALYEWHDGVDVPAFAGAVFLSIDEAIRERQFLMGLLGEPPSWVPLFRDGGGGGGRYFVEAIHPDASTDPGVWHKGKDYGPSLEYTSLAAMFDVLACAFDDGILSVVTFGDGRFAFEPESDEHFLAAQRHRDPEPREHRRSRSFFPAMDWPASWLAAIGVDKSSSTPTGDDVSPIADVIAASTDQPHVSTIAGRVKKNGSRAGLLWMTVEDESGLALVLFEGERSPLLDSAHFVNVEVDVSAGPAIDRPADIPHDRYPGHPVKGLAIRLHEPERQ